MAFERPVPEDELLPAAVVLTDEGRDLVPVVEVDGVLVDRRDGAPVDLPSVVVVVGLELVRSTAA